MKGVDTMAFYRICPDRIWIRENGAVAMKNA